jgi:hypothetical protein
MTVVIVGVDPGSSTGLASLQDGRRGLVWQGPADQALDVLRNEISFLLATHAELQLEVVCERFIQRQSPGLHLTHQPKALEVTGAVEDVCMQVGIPFTLQNPGDAKILASNHLLRSLSLYVTAREVGQNDSNDVNDAMRHVLLRLATKYATIMDELLKSALR